MSTTWCLGKFAQRLQKLSRDKWKREVEAMPETCPKDCKVNCRAVCAEYARMQWRMARQRGAA